MPTVIIGACALLVWGSQVAAEVRPIAIRTPDSAAGPSERTYFIASGATEEGAIAFRRSLVDGGARCVNLFLPDRVIVCELPANASADLIAPPGFVRQRERELDSRPSRGAGEPWGWIREAYRVVDRPAGAEAAGSAIAAPEFRDLVYIISPDEAREIQKQVEWSQSLRPSAPKPQVARSIQQNSEFLGGSILFNFIFPESSGQLDAESEDWSDTDLIEAHRAAAEAVFAWENRFASMDISCVIRYYDRVETGYEPIQHTDESWIVDTMHSLGWGLEQTMSQPIVHEFNEAGRAQAGTDWVVTAFIASSRNEPGHNFRGAGYTAYAYLGGPFMVEPFPAGTDPGIGERLVFSQIAQHELGHEFWTLDEYPGAPGTCSTRSGYLNWSNENITIVGPAGEVRCTPLVECIMHTAARKNLGSVWCKWSEGHFGVIDDNGNAIPDIFEKAPEVVWQIEGPETVTTNRVTLRFRAVSVPVPNRNPYQLPEDRVSYAVPLRNGTLSLGGPSAVPLTPTDGEWDEVEEEFLFPVSLSQTGRTDFAVRTRSDAGLWSPWSSKSIYFLGVHYTGVGASVQRDRIDVSWKVVGESFGAMFDVYRLENGESPPGARINKENVPPSGPGSGGFVPYQFTDRDVIPAHDYRYYVEGVFSLPVGDSLVEYRSSSPIVGQTAMIPILDGSILSNAAPNPFRHETTLSVQVPRSFSGSPTAPIRVPTAVEVAVYDVRGRRVKTLKHAGEFSDVVTVRWDGTNVSNAPVSSGIYFIRAAAGDATGVRKVLLVR